MLRLDRLSLSEKATARRTGCLAVNKFSMKRKDGKHMPNMPEGGIAEKRAISHESDGESAEGSEKVGQPKILARQNADAEGTI